VKHVYDDKPITLSTEIQGDPKVVAKVKTVDFVVTTTKAGEDEEEAPVKAKVSGGKASHPYKPAAVADDQDCYELRYEVRMAPEGTEEPRVEHGAEDYQIWPHLAELKFESDDNKAHKGAKFTVKQQDKISGVRTAKKDGTWSAKLEKATFEVAMHPPWAFDGDVTHEGRKRTYKVKRNPYKFEFIAPKTSDGGASGIECVQFVNLSLKSGAEWTEEEPFGHQLTFKVGAKGDTARDAADRLGQPGDPLYIEVNFTFTTDRDKPQPKLLNDHLDGAAVGSDSDKTWKGKAKLDAKGQVTFTVELGHAGGDQCEVKIGADDTCADAKLTFENWRKLYYELMYCDVMTPDLKDNGDGTFDFPDNMKSLADARLAAAYIQYECVAHHKFGPDKAKAGTIRPAAYVGQAGRDRFIIGGGLSSSNPVKFNAEDHHTIQIMMVDATYDDLKASKVMAPEVDQIPYEWTHPTMYIVPMKVDVAGYSWKAKIDSPDDYKDFPDFNCSEVDSADATATTIKITETKQSKSLSLHFKRNADGAPVTPLATAEKAKITPFVHGLLGVDALRKHDNALDFKIERPSDAAALGQAAHEAVETSFDNQKKEIYTHPGLDNAGHCRQGSVEAGWFSEVDHDSLNITLPTSPAGDGSKPGDYAGPLSDTKCPITVKFKVKECGKLCGWSQGARQVFSFDPPPMTPGALASTLCHELGHNMGMTIMAGDSKVPPGTDPAKHVDNGGLYYIDADKAPYTKGRRDLGAGPHCAHGVPPGDLPDSKFNGSIGDCIMFHSGDDADNQASFCDTCKTYLQARRLTDITSSWDSRSSDQS
jgi:hypothetical protein